MKKIGRSIVVIICLVVSVPVLAHTTLKWYAEQKTFVERTRPEQQKDVQWTLESWDEDNSDYAAAREKIDGMRGGSALKPAILLYEGLAKAQPNNPLAQFKWAYATWVSLDKYTPSGTVIKTMHDPIQAMLDAPYPHTYDYARLLVLRQSMEGVYFGAIHKHGDVMASAHPEDEELQYAVARMVVQFPNADYIKRYVPVLKKLQHKYPTDYRYALALVRYNQGVFSRNRYDEETVHNFVSSIRDLLKYPNLPTKTKEYFTKWVEAFESEMQKDNIDQE